MDLEEVTDVVLTLETELDLFDRTINGVRYWERVRFDIHREIRRDLGMIEQAQPTVDRSRFVGLQRMLRSLLGNNPFFAPSNDVLVYGHERRKRSGDGTWWDIYCDPVIEALEEDCTYIERPYEGGHLTPARTDGVWHLDFVTSAPLIPLQFTSIDVLLSDDDIASLKRIERRFRAETGVRPNLVDLVGRRLLQRRVRLPLYRRVLDRVDPDVVLTVVSYGREPFIEACQRHGVPVVELQHGVLSSYHLGYSFPDGRPKRTFPDYFLSFGEFWERVVALPLPSERIVPVGYPYLERRVEELARNPATSPEQLVFLSQGTIGQDLSRFAVEFADRNPAYDIVYKLHPSEYGRWQQECPWLREADLHVVDYPAVGLYELFAASSVQVGVYSTALYEGLQFDLDTYVVDIPGAAYMQELIEMNGATRIESVDELSAALSGGDGIAAVDTDRFFRPDAVANVRKALDGIRRGSDSFQH
jgi:hypothetical protein